MKLLEENIGKTFSDINCTNVFFGQFPKAIEIKRKINKWDLFKLNKLLHCKGNHEQNEKTTDRMGENICKWCKPKELNSKIYKQFIQLKSKQNKQTNWKMAEDLNRHFSKEEIQMANRHMKRCSTSLVSREMQIKTTMRYNLKSIRMAIIKKSTSNKCWRRCGEKKTLLPCWWECRLVQLQQKTAWRFLKRVKSDYHMTQQFHFCHISGENYNAKRHTHPYVHNSTIHNSQDMEATSMSTDRWMDKEDEVHMDTI